MTDKKKIRNIIELFIAWNGETEAIDVANLDSAVEFIKESLQEESVSEEFEKALAEEWQGYVDRGAATVDALEDNTQELAFAKGFYRGANWKKEQMMKDAVDATIMHFFSTSGNNTPKGRMIFCSNTLDNYEIKEKVKVVIIEEK